jgi:hypothetical protein
MIHQVVLVILITAVLGGCAQLPQKNDPPDPPELNSSGTFEPGLGVPVDVTCHDPDGDRVTIQFMAVTGGVAQPFEWTSFIDSGATETFYLDLSLGDWVLEAVARDELDEMGDPSAISITVHN